MKETYFTPENIDQKSRQMLEYLEKYTTSRNIKFIPEKSALLVIDMQRFFLDKNSHACIPSAYAIIPKIKHLINAYNKANLPVFFTRHVNTENDAKLMGRFWNDFIKDENPLSEIISDLSFPNMHVINKSQYDSFYNTDLEILLREKKITQVVITGVMTNLCCETTARSAFVRGFTPFFTLDGTAAYNEEFHRASILNISYGFGIITLIDEIFRSLSEH